MKKTAFLFVILTGILWGCIGVFGRYLTPYGFTSLQLTALRATVAFLILALFVTVRFPKAWRARPKDLWLYAAVGISVFGSSSCYFLSMQATSISTAVVLMYTAPAFVAVFSALVWKEHFSIGKLLAIGGMLLGCVFVSGILTGGSFSPKGVLFGLGSGLSYASYNIFAKLSAKRGCHPLTTTLYACLFMAVTALCFASPQTIPALIAARPAVTLPLILGLGIVTQVFPYLLYNSAVKSLSAGTASALSIVEPLSATLFGILLFSEPLTVFGVIGMLLIFFAVFLLGKTE